MDDQVQLMPDGMPIHLIHFIYQSPAGVILQQGERLAEGEDTWKIACIPQQREFFGTGTRPHPFRRTDDPRGVTCPQCKDTPAFKEHLIHLNALLANPRRRH